jgi:hypothetical protein
MDDLVLLDTDPNRLRPMVEIMDHWLRTERRQNLNPTKTKLTPLHQGVDYLGMQLKQVDRPSEPLSLTAPPDKKWKLVQEARRVAQARWDRTEDHHELSFPLGHKNRSRLQSINSRLGLLHHANSYRFRSRCLSQLMASWSEHDSNNDREELRILGADSFTPIRASPDFLKLKLRV